MKRYAWFGLLACFLIAADAPKADVATKDENLIQGTWKAVQVQKGDKKVGEGEIGNVKLIFKDGKYTEKQDDKVSETGTIKLDASKSPKTIDFKIMSGDDKGKTQHGVYELKGDVLKLSLPGAGEERPKDLSGNDVQVFTFKRQKE